MAADTDVFPVVIDGTATTTLLVGHDHGGHKTGPNPMYTGGHRSGGAMDSVRYRGRHRAGPHRLVAIVLCALLGFGISATVISTGAHASTLPKRLVAYYWAREQVGKPYEYGGTGPYGFDCSGLVMEAYAHAGIRLPRTTYDMLADVASGKLIPTSHPQKGDLSFYGSGHVELFVRWGHTFGAHDSGSLIGWIHYGYGFVPSAFFRVRGAG